MGSDDIFKKKRAERAARKYENRTAAPNSYLIVTEGEKTEPSYFGGMAAYIQGKFGGTIDVKTPVIQTVGKGMHTVSLVEETVRIVRRSRKMYQYVWVVFDKDDFEDFDGAVRLAEERGFKCAWSNQSFEYWLYLHFNYSDSALHRSEWAEKLDEIFKLYDIGTGRYEKNQENLFSLVTGYGSLKAAVGHGKRIRAAYPDQEKPSRCDPCTTVHNLILQLKPYLLDLS